MNEFWASTHEARLWLLRIVAALFLLCNVEFALQNTSVVLFQSPVMVNNAGRTTLGMEVSPKSSGEIGWRQVLAVDPSGAADMAGIRAGDEVRFATPWGYRRSWQPGEEVPLTVERGGEEFEATLAVQQLSFGNMSLIQKVGSFLWPLQSWIVIALGAVLLIRGRNDRAAIFLALFLLTARWPNALTWAPDWIFVPVWLFTALVIAFNPFWAARFGLEISGGAASRRQVSLLTTLTGAIAAWVIYTTIVQFFAIPDPLNLAVIGPTALGLGQLGVLVVIGWNFRNNDQAQRNRLKIVIAAFLMYLLPNLVNTVFGLSGISWLADSWFPTFGIVGVSLLTYAIMRQRLFDFGFAINRTLVYGAAAFTLLVTFGLVEYIAKSMIPVAWPTAGPFISAGIAVLLFLMFHRLHHWFEHHIERLFFSSWQQAEAALKRFVHSAGHYEQVPALCRDFTGELERFAGGAAAALYLRGDGGGFDLQAGKVPGAAKSYAEDGRGFALMRTERKPIDLARANHPLPGALALPMLDQGRLLGFALVGAKPDGAHYRPDEIENLDWAVHQVGLDIRALHARLLEERVGQLADENRLIAFERDKLSGLIDRMKA